MSSWFYRMKMKYQRYAIPNLALYASVCFAVGYMLISTGIGSQFFFRWLAFFPREVFHGQIWRILTAIVFPPSTGGIFNAVLGILIYYSFATAVENMMGEFEYNVYFFGSILIGEIGAVVYYLISGVNAPFLPLYTHFSVFMALAILYADATVLLFFLIPVKIKYIAIAEVAMYLYTFVTGTGVYGPMYTRISILFAFIPVLLFYMATSRSNGGSGNIIRDIRRSFENRRRQREWRNQWK